MIRLHAVSKTYRGDGEIKPVFENINLDLPAGRRIGIIGDKGSGKTTLLNLLCRQELPDLGNIEIDGRVSVPLGQNPGISPQLTGRENTAFIARVLGIPVPEMIRDVEKLAGLGRKFDQPFSLYPRPFRRRLNLAVALAARYDIYLVDETLAVTGSRSPESMLERFEVLKDCPSVLIASSRPKLLREQCDSIVVLENGSVRFYEDAKQGLRAFRANSPRFDGPGRGENSRAHHHKPIQSNKDAQKMDETPRSYQDGSP